MGLWFNNLFDQPFISIIEHNSMILIILFLRKQIQKKMLQYMHEKYCFLSFLEIQGAKRIIFSACHLGKLMLAFTSPNMISTGPKRFLMSRIDFTVLLQFEFHKKHHLPIRQVKNNPLAPGYQTLLSLHSEIIQRWPWHFVMTHIPTKLCGLYQNLMSRQSMRWNIDLVISSVNGVHSWAIQ